MYNFLKNRIKNPKALIRWSMAAIFLLGILSIQAIASDQGIDYKLGFEDVITVTVINHSEFSGEFFIPVEGSVSIPGVGQIAVSGKTSAIVASEIKTRLSDRLRDPEVYITVKMPRQPKVNVLGAVNGPGAYPIKPGWRITECLSAAGGLGGGSDAAECTVHILRNDGTKISVSLQEAMRGDEKSNILLLAGDVMTVESAEMIPIYVMGKVRSPGIYRMRKDTASILTAIAIAGGTQDDAALSKVTVTHLSGQTETVSIIPVTLNGKEETTTKLMSGDLVVVPDSTAKFAILGWVNSPGFFPLKENQVVRLSDAIGIANGVDNRRSGLDSVAILRTTNGKQERKLYNFSKFARGGDMAQNPTIQAGDIVLVPETKTPDIDRILSRIGSSLSLFWAFNKF